MSSLPSQPGAQPDGPVGLPLLSQELGTMMQTEGELVPVPSFKWSWEARAGSHTLASSPAPSVGLRGKKPQPSPTCPSTREGRRACTYQVSGHLYPGALHGSPLPNKEGRSRRSPVAEAPMPQACFMRTSMSYLKQQLWEVGK